MRVVDVKAILLRTHNNGAVNDIDLGSVYELFRDGNNINNVGITRPLHLATIQQEWRMCSVTYVGETEMAQESIEAESVEIGRLPSHSSCSIEWKSLEDTVGV